MNTAGRLELERALRERGDVGSLLGATVHNVRLHTGTVDLYGRDDWVRLETERFTTWGPRVLADAEGIDGKWGSAAALVAARWRLGPHESAPRAACLSIVHAGRIVREWQYLDSGALPGLAGTGNLAHDVWAPWEYGEVRAALGQVVPEVTAGAVASPEIAGHPLVEYWHQRWNRRSGEVSPLLAAFSDPVMFCERLVAAADGRTAALQWRLVGRHVVPAWGRAPRLDRLELPGLSFFQFDGERIMACGDHYDLTVLSGANAPNGET